MQWQDQRREAEHRIAWVLDHPQTSPWLKSALRTAQPCHPVAVLNDIEMLHEVLRFWAEAVILEAHGKVR